MAEYKLPYQDTRGFCNILISAIGGDGANMAAKQLFKIGVEAMGLDGSYDARYGSEKKGTATDVCVRLCHLGTPIRETGPNYHAHILAIFRPGVIKAMGFKKGLQKDATVIINTTESPEQMRKALEMNSGTIICLDAAAIVAKTNSRLNMPMLAVISKVLGIPDEVTIKKIEDTWPRAKEANVAAYKEANSLCIKATFKEDGSYPLVPYTTTRGQIGYLNMLNGGAIDSLTHSTINRDNQVSGYGFVPEFSPEACTGCAICMSVCSDPGGIIWKDGKVIGVNTAFCKGCMRCVEVCPETKKGKAFQLPEELKSGLVEV